MVKNYFLGVNCLKIKKKKKKKKKKAPENALLFISWLGWFGCILVEFFQRLVISM